VAELSTYHGPQVDEMDDAIVRGPGALNFSHFDEPSTSISNYDQEFSGESAGTIWETPPAFQKNDTYDSESKDHLTLAPEKSTKMM
jgi:hypothetical protein